MPTRRAAPQKKASPEAPENSDGDYYDFPLSQQSNSGEEQKDKFLELLKQHYAATAEKEREKKEKKLMEWARKELDIKTEATQIMNDTVKEIECIYTKFLVEYASCEDRIQAKWAHLQETQGALVELVEHRKKKDLEILSLEPVAVFPGISKMKASRKAINATIEHLDSRLRNEDIEGSDDSEE